MIDDSSLFHGEYDPVKARAYYLRTRKLKGRKAAAAKPAPSPRTKRAAPGTGNRANTKSRRAELEAQKEALKKRLDRLREVLAQKVKEAEALASKNAPKGKDSSDKAPETKADVADRGKHEKSKKLTASQKAKKAKAAKEKYEKEHPNSLSKDVEILREQVKEIRAKIKNAIEDASRARQKQAGTKKR